MGHFNDIELSLRNSKVRLYADNTVLYVSGPSLNHACTLLQSDLDETGVKRTTTVNSSKTKAILFGRGML